MKEISDFARRLSWSYYALSVATLLASVAVAARLYPSDFDWQYTVVSALASQKHNPRGGVWFSAGLGLSLVWLWPFLRGFALRPLAERTFGERFSFGALRLGIIFGGLMAVESILNLEGPLAAKKLHEALALFCFLSFYTGIIGLSISRLRSDRRFLWPAVLILFPLAAIGLGQLSLYLGQRDIGWVDVSWREMGIPVWQSFAFWQWQAVLFLWTSMGLLGWLHRK